LFTNKDSIATALSRLADAAVAAQRALAADQYLDSGVRYVTSSDGTTVYRIQRQWTCACPGWKFRGECRHLREAGVS